jgi:hypothetical protein
MSKGLELFDEFIKTHNPGFTDTCRGKVLFCKGTPCYVCPLENKTQTISCSISVKEVKKLKETNPEYFI